MTITIRPMPAKPKELATFKEAMRHLVGGVSVITAGSGETRTGLTVTSAISLSLDPPTMLVCVNRNASAWPVIQRESHYCVNILDGRHQHVADRFAGRGGVKGSARYEGARWRQFATGAWGLEDALAVIDCHGIIIGAVQRVHVGGGDQALIYGHGRYRALGLA
jgi:flavin reductase (DIM6/NTAB) family NADH-FMN oxidoreductase RutF